MKPARQPFIPSVRIPVRMRLTGPHMIAKGKWTKTPHPPPYGNDTAQSIRQSLKRAFNPFPRCAGPPQRIRELIQPQTPTHNMQYSITYTDTFAGEANYAWVRRTLIDAPDNASNALLVRRAKRAMDITGRHRTEPMGDVVAIYPAQSCTVLFIEPTCEEDEHRMEGRA